MRFVSITRRLVSGGTSSKGPNAVTEALFTHTSILPKCFTALLATTSTASRSLTSAVIGRA
jgi:hypothetical protein